MAPMSTFKNPSFARSAAVLLAMLVLAGASGCNILGPAYVLVAGPPKYDPLWDLERDRMHVIVIDDLRNRLPKRSLRTVASREAEDRILRRGLLPEDRLIPSSAAYALLSEETAREQMSIVDMGRRLGAEVVIYITVDVWQLSQDGVSASPIVGSRVKILDVVQNRRVWPSTEVGFMLRVEPDSLKGEMPVSYAQRSTLERNLAEQMGLAIAQMFYKHEIRESARD